MTKKEAIQKIKKCLALSASSNEFEAEAALRQAQALMEKYNINDADIDATGATEAFGKASARCKPARWEMSLARRVAKAFACELLFVQGITRGQWSFIGTGLSAEIASYAFEVLLRQCKRARSTYIKTKLKRCKLATVVMRADIFCEGWVYTAAHKISEIAPNDAQEKSIKAYLSVNYPTLVEAHANDRRQGKSLKNSHLEDLLSGRSAGNTAELNRGVHGADNAGLLN